jgi:hypothetical protein
MLNIRTETENDLPPYGRSTQPHSQLQKQTWSTPAPACSPADFLVAEMDGAVGILFTIRLPVSHPHPAWDGTPGSAAGTSKPG